MTRRRREELLVFMHVIFPNVTIPAGLDCDLVLAVLGESPILVQSVAP